MIKANKYYFLSLLAFGIFLLVVSSSFRNEKTATLTASLSLTDKLGFKNLSGKVGYVGIDECRKCHEDMYRAYMKTGMGQSWGPATPAKSMAVFKTLFDEKTGMYYKPYWQGNVMMVMEYRLNGGDTVFKRIEKVDYVVGSGQHTNSHLRLRNGYLYQVPFTYYTQLGILDMPPGFEGGHNVRFSRKIGFECITCHNSYPIPVEGSENKYKNIPHGINCERCHGPGELHVKAMKRGETVDITKEADYTIVNPKRLPPALQNELCARCHTQGNAVLQEGKSFFDFLPGMKVSDVMYVFREKYENDEDAFWMETHPERLSRSACYQKTQNHPDYAPLTCLSCHFTNTMKHVSFRETPIDTFRMQCIRCHNERDKTACNIAANRSGNCITCHMVRTGVFDIPHVVISDHHIRVTDKWKEPVKSTAEIQTGNFLGLKSMTGSNPGNLIMARAFMLHYEKFYPLPALLDSAYKYLRLCPEKENTASWVYYYFLKNDNRKVISMAENYHLEKSKDALLLYQAGQCYLNLQDNENAVNYFRNAVGFMPYNLDYREKLSSALMAAGDMQGAKRELEFIVKESPESPRVLNNLAFICLTGEDLINAEKYLKKALALDPDYINAHINMAKVFIGKGEISRAYAYLDKINKNYPGNPQVIQLMRIIASNR